MGFGTRGHKLVIDARHVRGPGGFGAFGCLNRRLVLCWCLSFTFALYVCVLRFVLCWCLRFAFGFRVRVLRFGVWRFAFAFWRFAF